MTLGYWEVNVYIIFLFVFCRLRWLVPLLCLLSLVDFGSSEDRVHVRNEYGQLVTSSTLLWMPANSTLMPNYTVSAAEDPVLRKYRNAPTALTLVLSAARFARNTNVLGNSSTAFLVIIQKVSLLNTAFRQAWSPVLARISQICLPSFLPARIYLTQIKGKLGFQIRTVSIRVTNFKLKFKIENKYLFNKKK